MKYLLSAIEARRGRLTGGRNARPKFNAEQLTQALMEANDGLDDKSSTHEFVDTLERIVNEIRNITEHSTAFLQKVKKTEAPDYYNVISRPMDLATLQKRVKANMYRNKKAFAEDLDLIWSNCLTYNSHPSHPLRHSAETLRLKSNALLEFISDPSLPSRPIFSTIANGASRSVSQMGTPMPGGEDGDDEGDSADERRSRAGTEDPLHKLTNGINGDGRDRSNSPMGSRSQTPLGERPPPRKLGRGPLGRRSLSPATVALKIFAERPSIARTQEGMSAFVDLDAELNRLDSALGFGQTWTAPVASTSTLPAPPANAVAVLPTGDGPSIAPSPAATMPISQAGTPAAAIAPATPGPPVSDEDDRLLALVRVLNPPAAVSAAELPTVAPTPASASSFSPASFWWQTVASGQGIAAGVPDCAFPGSAPSHEGLDGAASIAVQRKKGKGRGKKQGVDRSLGARMQRNFETLKSIRGLHGELGGETVAQRVDTPESSTSFADTGVEPHAFSTAAADHAGRESLSVVSSRVLGHAGFDGTSAMALGVLAHVAAEYIVNLGRTLRFYSDRYGSTMTAEQILLHVLSENGIPSPASLENYVHEDIDRYGAKLEDLKGKLQRAKQARRDAMPGAEAGGDTKVSPLEPSSTASDPDLPFSPPPPFIPLSPSLSATIGLLKPFLALRQATELELTDDYDLPSTALATVAGKDGQGKIKAKIGRLKVPPSGRIAVKSKRKGEETGGRNKRREA